MMIKMLLLLLLYTVCTNAFIKNINILKSFIVYKATLDTPPTTSSNEVFDNLPSLPLAEALSNTAQIADVGNFEPTFYALSSNKEFLENYFQKKPYHYNNNGNGLKNINGAFTMDDVKYSVENDFLEAGRGTFDANRGGWNMAAVSTPRGNSFEDAKLRYEDVETAMKQKSGTVVFNSAGGFIPKVALINLQFTQAFEMPSATNMYLTAAGQTTSAPPHTDKQDVFVFQTQGAKRWRVYSPPPPSRMPRADPFARGKGTDQLNLSELDEPLIDTVLSPGQILYVPAGYPHTTDTIENNAIDLGNGDDSVHLTIGLDSHIWYLNYAMLREICLRRAGLEDKLQRSDKICKLDPEKYWKLQDCLPVGIFAVPYMFPHKGNGMAMRKAQIDAIVTNLITRMRMAEPTRWSDDISDDQIALEVEAITAAEKIVDHHDKITETFANMYADVGMKITQVQMDLSFFRSKPYMEALEKLMESLIEWSSAGKPAPPPSGRLKKDANKIKKDKGGTKKNGGGFGKK